MAKTPTKAQAQQTGNETLPEIDDDAAEIVEEAGAADEPERGAQQQSEQREEPEDPRDAIARKYRENRDNKAREAEETDESVGGADVDGDDGDDEPAQETKKPPGAKPEAATQDVELVLKVDGKDVKMKQSEVLALAQQQMAAMNRLDEAKNVLSEVRQLKSELLANARAPRVSDDPENQRDRPDEKSTQKQATSQDNGDVATNQSRLNIDTEKVREIARRVQVGDEADGVEAFMDVVEIAAKANPGMSPQRVAEIVQQTIEENQTAVEINKALSDFGNDYPDVVKNEYLADAGLHILRDELVADLKAAGIPEDRIAPIQHDASALAKAQRLVRRQNPKANMRSYGELMGAVGEKLTSNFGIKRREDSTPPTTQQQASSQQRLERKRSSSQQPKPAGGRQAITPPAKPRDRRAIVEQIRRERGFTS